MFTIFHYASYLIPDSDAAIRSFADTWPPMADNERHEDQRFQQTVLPTSRVADPRRRSIGYAYPGMPIRTASAGQSMLVEAINHRR